MPTWLFPKTRPPLRRRLLRLGSVFVVASVVGAAIEVVALSLQAARTIVYPPRSAEDATPAERGLPFERVTFQSADGTRLQGWFLSEGRATVVLAHGHGASKAGMLGYAELLQKRGGYSILLFDFRASGESEGTQATLGFHEWQDVLGAIRYLRARPDVDSDRIGALGASMGAAALLLLGQEAHQLRAVVADSSFASGESLVGRFDRWFRLPSLPFSLSVPWAIEHYVGIKPRDVAPLSTVGAISPTPLFIIHGEEDTGVAVADAHLLYEAAGEPKELWIIPGVGHGGGLSEVSEEYQRSVLAFFERHLAE